MIPLYSDLQLNFVVFLEHMRIIIFSMLLYVKIEQHDRKEAYVTYEKLLIKII